MRFLLTKFSSIVLAALLLSACGADSDPLLDQNGSSPQIQDEVHALDSSRVSESVDEQRPSLPALPGSDLPLEEQLLNAQPPKETGTLDDLPLDTLDSDPNEAFEAATQPDSIDDCQAMQAEALRDLCYQSGGYSDNAASVEADLVE